MAWSTRGPAGLLARAVPWAWAPSCPAFPTSRAAPTPDSRTGSGVPLSPPPTAGSPGALRMARPAPWHSAKQGTHKVALLSRTKEPPPTWGRAPHCSARLGLSRLPSGPLPRPMPPCAGARQSLCRWPLSQQPGLPHPNRSRRASRSCEGKEWPGHTAFRALSPWRATGEAAGPVLTLQCALPALAECASPPPLGSRGSHTWGKSCMWKWWPRGQARGLPGLRLPGPLSQAFVLPLS